MKEMNPKTKTEKRKTEQTEKSKNENLVCSICHRPFSGGERVTTRLGHCGPTDDRHICHLRCRWAWRERTAAAAALAGVTIGTGSKPDAATGRVDDAAAPYGLGSPARVAQPVIRPERVDRGKSSFRG